MQAALGPGSGCVDEYFVMADLRMADEHLVALPNGVVLRTVTRREQGRVQLVAPTRLRGVKRCWLHRRARTS